MEPILIPQLPASAFNKNRPPSDLLLSQLEHFKHLDAKLNLGLNPKLAKSLHTENGAAIYITAMTRALRTRALAAQAAKGIVAIPTKKSAVAKKTPRPAGLSIAAETATSEISAPTNSTEKQMSKSTKKSAKKSTRKKT